MLKECSAAGCLAGGGIKAVALISCFNKILSEPKHLTKKLVGGWIPRWIGMLQCVGTGARGG